MFFWFPADAGPALLVGVCLFIRHSRRGRERIVVCFLLYRSTHTPTGTRYMPSYVTQSTVRQYWNIIISPSASLSNRKWKINGQNSDERQPIFSSAKELHPKVRRYHNYNHFYDMASRTTISIIIITIINLILPEQKTVTWKAFQE